MCQACRLFRTLDTARAGLGPDGALYASELSTGNAAGDPFYRPNAGKVVRQTGPSGQAEVATGPNYPVHLGFGPDGALYVGGPAIGSNGGEGTVLRIDSTAGPISLSGMTLPRPSCTAAP